MSAFFTSLLLSIGISLPCILLAAGLALILVGFRRRLRHLPASPYLIPGILLVLIPLLLFGLFFLSGAFGLFPVPN